MPEPVNPFVPGPGSPGGREAMKHRGWADCDRAWRGWLASDEAAERAARAIMEASEYTYDAKWYEIPKSRRKEWRSRARAVLAALRGDT